MWHFRNDCRHVRIIYRIFHCAYLGSRQELAGQQRWKFLFHLNFGSATFSGANVFASANVLIPAIAPYRNSLRRNSSSSSLACADFFCPKRPRTELPLAPFMNKKNVFTLLFRFSRNSIRLFEFVVGFHIYLILLINFDCNVTFSLVPRCAVVIWESGTYICSDALSLSLWPPAFLTRLVSTANKLINNWEIRRQIYASQMTFVNFKKHSFG